MNKKPRVVRQYGRTSGYFPASDIDKWLWAVVETHDNKPGCTVGTWPYAEAYKKAMELIDSNTYRQTTDAIVWLYPRKTQRNYRMLKFYCDQDTISAVDTNTGEIFQLIKNGVKLDAYKSLSYSQKLRLPFLLNKEEQ